MSHPNPSHDRENEYPEDKVTHYPKGGLVEKIGKMARRVKGLQETKHFGAKRRARHKAAQRSARGESPF